MDNFGLIHRLSPNNGDNVDKTVDKYAGLFFPMRGIVDGMDKFFHIDMYLRGGGLFLIFEQAHGVADVVVVKV